MGILQIGDVVTYIKECEDHLYNDEDLEIGNQYTICGIRLVGLDGWEVYPDDVTEASTVEYRLEEASWWVGEDCVVLLGSSVEGKLNAVCRKIKQIEAKRKALGYRW